MQRAFLLSLALLAVAACGETGNAPTAPNLKPAGSGSSSWQNISRLVNDDGSLTVSFGISGVGNNDVTVTLTGDVTASYGCINGGDNHPKAQNKEGAAGGFSVTNTFQSRNGQIDGSLTSDTPPVPSDADIHCGTGQRFQLLSVSYTNCVLHNGTTGSTAAVANISRTFPL